VSSFNLSISPTAVLVGIIALAGLLLLLATCTALWSPDPAQREHARLVLADLLRTLRVLGRGDNGEPRP
jgi:hypothetical protein